MTCISEALPFNQIDDDIEYLQALSHKDHFEIYWDSIYEKLFNPFTFNEDDHFLDDVDPDDNFYNDIMTHSSSLCKYYLQDDFNKEILNYSKDAFSLCHLNVRSLQQNFSTMETFLENLKIKFTILGVTETWLTDINSNLYNLQNYSFIEKHRTNRSGGGVGIYLPEHL